MGWIADLPIQRKLRFSMLLTSAVALVSTCVIFLGFEFYVFRVHLERNLTTLARITAYNSTAALAFSDTERARETLQALAAESQIVGAALYDNDGRLLASFAPRAPQTFAPSSLPAEGVFWESGFVVSAAPVIEEQRRLGTLYIRASLEQVMGRMRVYVAVGCVALGFAFWIAWVLASRLQRAISRPILELAQTVHAVSQGQDFSLRAPQYGSDELGRLAGEFNAMLETTQSAVAALRESEARFRHMADSAPVLIWLADITKAFTWFNQRWLDFVGRPLDREVRHGWMDNIHADDLERCVQVYFDSFEMRRPFQVEFRLRRHDGVYRWIVDHGVPRVGAEGAFTGYIGCCIDVTERREAQQQVERARDEALAASRAKDHFLAALSHELRTPLNPVLLLASDAAMDPALSSEVRASFDLIRRNVMLEARLIDDLLDLTRIARGKVVLDWVLVDVHAVLQEAIATIRPDVVEKRIQLELHLSPGEARVWGDPARLQQVFWNVLKNALKFTPEKGRIDVSTAIDAANDRLTVSVADTGIGLTAEELTRIFDAFGQGDHAADGGVHRFGGLGLGLAISRSLAEMHGGAIRATSAGRDLGATFILELPRARPAPRADGDSPVPRAESGQASRPRESGLRLLLVEDHLPTRMTLQRLLMRRQHDVVVAASLAEAREAGRGGRFDLLISDLGLPDGDGCLLMQELRETHPRLYGIVMSGYGMEMDRARTRAAGFHEHLTKPVDIAQLDQAIARFRATL